VPSPFGFRLPGAVRFAPVRARSSSKTRRLTSVWQSQPFVRSPLPLRAVQTPPDQSVQPDSRLRGSPPEHSRLPVTPRRRFNFISPDARSPLEARFAFSGSLFHRPLGTTFIIHPRLCYSQMKIGLRCGFSQLFIHIFFNYLEPAACASPVEKTRPCASVLELPHAGVRAASRELLRTPPREWPRLPGNRSAVCPAAA